jgi:uncharacterized phage infection (PIP) family protein YhgE
MNKKSTEIKTELDATANRLDELTIMRDVINAHLKTLQDGFISGKTSLDEVQAEQNKLTTLDSSIQALEAKQDELRSAFQKASASENRQALLEKAKVAAIEAEKFHTEFISIRNEFHDLICNYAQKTISKMSAWREKQRDFRRLSEETKLSFEELEQLGLQPESYKVATADFINPPPIEYGESLNAAINFLAAKLDRAAQAKTRAEFHEKRANQEKMNAQTNAAQG